MNIFRFFPFLGFRNFVITLHSSIVLTPVHLGEKNFSNQSDFNLSRIPSKFSFGQPTKFPFLIFQAGQKSWEMFRAHRRSLLSNHTTPVTSSPTPTYHLPPHKVISMPLHAIPHLFTPMEEHFPCVAQNIFSIHSSCYYFVNSTAQLGHITPLMR